MVNNTELCPKCGKLSVCMFNDGDKYQIKCEKCGLHTDWYKTIKTTIKKWEAICQSVKEERDGK